MGIVIFKSLSKNFILNLTLFKQELTPFLQIEKHNKIFLSSVIFSNHYPYINNCNS